MRQRSLSGILGSGEFLINIFRAHGSGDSRECVPSGGVYQALRSYGAAFTEIRARGGSRTASVNNDSRVWICQGTLLEDHSGEAKRYQLLNTLLRAGCGCRMRRKDTFKAML